MKILVTGGAGYIGSTTASALKDFGHEVIILDSLVNGQELFTKDHYFYKGDIADTTLVKKIFNDHPDIYACIHFAALIVVPESVKEPYLYYRENVLKSLELFKTLNEVNCKRVIFSSSASLYGYIEGFKVDENGPMCPSSPYARTKYMMEMILEDMSKVSSFKSIALRYFNPIGSDPQFRTGPYDPNPSHVLGKMVDVALGKDEIFSITGVDWPTRDGSGIRDYIHVWDLARAHVLAVENFDSAFKEEKTDYMVINLGSGNGTTVKELVSAFERAWGSEINKCEAPPRLGDVAGAYADCSKAQRLLGWKAELSITQGMSDALTWTNKKRKEILGY